MSINVMFRVNVETFKGQVVCVVGDDPLLGVWDPLKAVVMERDFTGQNWKQWKCSIALQVNTTYHYRFFVCKQQQISKKKSECSHDPKTARAPGLTVYKWETNIKPRHFTTGGNCDLLELPESVFGKYDDEFNVGKGWLINQSEVQIRLHSNPIYMWKARHREQTYSIKCIAMDYSSQNDPSVNDDNDDSQDGPVPCSVDDVLACNLADEDSQPEIQGPAGMLYNKDSYVVFRKQLQDTQHEGFQLDFFVCEQNRAPKFVGSAHLLPFKQKESQYSRKFPIIGCNHKPIGEIMVDFLIGRPVPGLVMTMETTFQTRWKWRKAGDKPLDIGHRGMGVSYSQVVNPLKENTLASFAAAAGHGADFVEFDVLLSRDKKPVIYHDFSVKALYSNRTKHNVPSELFEIPVKSLTLAQLQSMKLFSSDHSHIEINEETDEESKEPFPTLEKVLKVVDENTGFDIEIKYPQLDINEVWEMENYFDVNENLDHILQVVFAHAGSRKIVFSSFDPDTCILLQLKQNKYPVLFLHQGQTKIYTPYKDYRAYSFKNGIGFAVSENFLGLALHSEVLLQDMSLINRVLNKKLVLFVWGSDNNNPKMIRMLRDHKVDGIIYDRIDCHKPEYHPEFELVSETAAQSFMNVVQMDDRATVHYASSPDQNGAISEFTLDQPTLNEAVAAKTDLVESINKQLTCALVDTESA